PLKKDQIMMDVEVAKNHKALMQAELEEEDRLARQKEEETNIASKGKKAARNHDPLALVANSHAHSSYSHASSSYSRSPQPYYITHPSSVTDNDDYYQGEIQGDAQEDKLSTVMMLLA
nr:hypothetical protein [Tanacetum cinerariifolium]